MQSKQTVHSPGGGPELAPNMAYAPRSRPAFPGDRQHDVRDHQLDLRLDTLAGWVGTAAGLYLRAAIIVGVEASDPIADTLRADDRFDARTLWVVHDHMAAAWRAHEMPRILAEPFRFIGAEDDRSVMTWAPSGLMMLFRRSLKDQTEGWGLSRPAVLRLFLRTLVADHGRTGQRLEAELFFALAHLYPVPGQHLPPPLPGLFAADNA